MIVFINLLSMINFKFLHDVVVHIFQETDIVNSNQ